MSRYIDDTFSKISAALSSTNQYCFTRALCSMSTDCAVTVTVAAGVMLFLIVVDVFVCYRPPFTLLGTFNPQLDLLRSRTQSHQLRYDVAARLVQHQPKRSDALFDRIVSHLHRNYTICINFLFLYFYMYNLMRIELNINRCTRTLINCFTSTQMPQLLMLS